MLNWLKRLFGGSDDSQASSPAEAAPAVETAPPPAETTASDPTAPAEGATDPSADEPA
jgi:hypothetical protein